MTESPLIVLRAVRVLGALPRRDNQPLVVKGL